MKKSKECENCGKMFVPTNTRSLYCSEHCRKESKKLIKKQQRERAKMAAGTRNNATINQINAMALKEHISYGQYVAKYGI